MEHETTLADIVWDHAFAAMAAADWLAYEGHSGSLETVATLMHHLEHIMIVTKPWPSGHPLADQPVRLEPVGRGHSIPQLVQG